MYLPSSKHHFDTMFVILCVIARASSHNISDTSKSFKSQLNNQYRASFMNFILDANLIQLLHSSSSSSSFSPSSNLIKNKHILAYSSSSHNKPTSAASTDQRSRSVCAQLANYLSDNQMKFCHHHGDILGSVLLDALQLTKQECKRITSDLKWNCPSIEPYLDKSSPLAFTREAALVRSIFNASMMYLVVKTCITSNHHSCGCQNYPTTKGETKQYAPQQQQLRARGEDMPVNNTATFKQEDLSASDWTKLDSGSPVRISKSILHRDGCIANVAFASAFSKIFIESDDSKALDKASRVLNWDYKHDKSNKTPYKERLVDDQDYRDLAYTKWSKAAISIHNNNVGRRVQIENYGTYWEPDLRLALLSSGQSEYFEQSNALPSSADLTDSYFAGADSTNSPETLNQLFAQTAKLKPDQLVYFNESPDYCQPQLAINHMGIKGRPCALVNNMSDFKEETSKKNSKSAAELNEEAGYNESRNNIFSGAPGLCKKLCCNRGHHNELVLDMVACNCKFKFCCHLDCGQCLRQRVQHFCL